MDTAELWGRLREGFLHATETGATRRCERIRLQQGPCNTPTLPNREEASQALKDELSAQAATLLAGRWKLYGWKEVSVSSPPDWHRDHVKGASVPMNARRINHRSLPGGADVRAIWEINRWSEVVRLAMHGWLNSDVEAIAQAQAWLADWVDKNPVGKGVNWTSALESGLRLINFCWFDALVTSLTGQEFNGLQKTQSKLRDAIVPTHVWRVARYLSFGSSANNHRLGELTGLLLAAKRWPELESITGPTETLWEQLTECVLSQFAEDGGNREQALHYHLFAFEMALHASRAMRVHEGPVIDRLQSAAEFFSRISHPTEPWDYGDSDDAQIVPLAMYRERAVAEWQAWMSGSDGDLGNSLQFWLGDMCRQSKPSMTNGDKWWTAEESGMAVVERNGWMVRVDASPLGFGKMAAHGHCDALHVSIWDGDHALVIDPGTGAYYGDQDLREELAAWRSHNGPLSHDEAPPLRTGTFLWSGKHDEPALDLVNDDVFVRMRNGGCDFSRCVRFVDNSNRIAVWDLEAGKKPFRVRWYFAPECSVRSVDVRVASFEIRRDEKAWSMSLMSDGEVRDVKITAGRASSSFGRVQPCTVIEVLAQGSLRSEWHRL